MKLIAKIGIIFFYFFLQAVANANNLTNIKFSINEVDLDNEVVLQLTLVEDVNPIYCGLLINWGDGRLTKYRIGADAEIKPPFTIRQKFSSEGVKNISAKGELMIRGLKTLPPCQGVHTTSIKVVDFARIEKEKSILETARKAEDGIRAAALEAQLAREELDKQRLAEQKQAREIERQNAELMQLRAELEKSKQQERNASQRTSPERASIKTEPVGSMPAAKTQKNENIWTK